MREYLAGLLRLLDEGGTVMPVLMGMALVLWYLIAFRALTLREWLVRDALASGRAVLKGAPGLEPDAARERVALGLAGYERELVRGRVLVTCVVLTAPLLGLLGTVSGMIETFDALGTQAMSVGSGGIAAGIAEALLATEMGLCVAIPGMIAGRLLDRREARLRARIERVPVDLVQPEAPCAA